MHINILACEMQPPLHQYEMIDHISFFLLFLFVVFILSGV